MASGQFEVYPEVQQVVGGKALHPRHGVVDAPNRQELTGDFGWRYRAPNGQISAIGGEGFTRRESAGRAIIDFLSEVGCSEPRAPIVNLDENGDVIEARD
jgi:uncharacterized protein YegP (UPF0339 family)